MIHELKQRFFDYHLNQSNDKDQEKLLADLENRWNTLQQIGGEGFAFFLEYANNNFGDSCYQNILSHLEEANEALLCSKGDLSRHPIPISKELLNTIYQAARELFEQSLFEHSYSLFYILSFLSPGSFDVWLGLGLNYQQLEDHQKAVMAFLEAAKIHPEHFFVELYLAESYCALKKWKEAYECSVKALTLASKSETELIDFLKSVKHLSEQEGKVA